MSLISAYGEQAGFRPPSWSLCSSELERVSVLFGHCSRNVTGSEMPKSRTQLRVAGLRWPWRSLRFERQHDFSQRALPHKERCRQI